MKRYTTPQITVIELESAHTIAISGGGTIDPMPWGLPAADNDVIDDVVGDVEVPTEW